MRRPACFCPSSGIESTEYPVHLPASSRIASGVAAGADGDEAGVAASASLLLALVAGIIQVTAAGPCLSKNELIIISHA